MRVLEITVYGKGRQRVEEWFVSIKADPVGQPPDAVVELLKTFVQTHLGAPASGTGQDVSGEKPTPSSSPAPVQGAPTNPRWLKVKVSGDSWPHKEWLKGGGDDDLWKATWDGLTKMWCLDVREDRIDRAHAQIEAKGMKWTVVK